VLVDQGIITRRSPEDLGSVVSPKIVEEVEEGEHTAHKPDKSGVAEKRRRADARLFSCVPAVLRYL